MLAKSRKSAVIMACIALLAAMTVAAVGEWLKGAFSGVEARGVRSLAEFVLGAGLFVLAGFLLVSFSAAWIYRLDDSHFGPQGAIRWAVFGTLGALLLQGVSLLAPEPGASVSLGVYMVNRAFRLGLGAVILYAAHWAAFRLFRKQGQDPSPAL